MEKNIPHTDCLNESGNKQNLIVMNNLPNYEKLCEIKKCIPKETNYNLKLNAGEDFFSSKNVLIDAYVSWKEIYRLDLALDIEKNIENWQHDKILHNFFYSTYFVTTFKRMLE